MTQIWDGMAEKTKSTLAWEWNKTAISQMKFNLKEG